MLEAQAVNKRFGGLRAVADVSLNVQAGEIVALIGPNGAGKTTLFAMLAGFLRPDSGRVRFQNQDITGLKPHRICRLGMVRTFQMVKPFAGLSVRDNIAVAAHVRVAERKTTLALADTIAAQVGMKAALNKPASSLTVAGRKRLELARALATGPKLLLLDEVMAGLNATEIDDIVPVVRAIRDSGITVLLIEHVLRAVMSLSDRGYVLNQGAIIATGTPAEITRDPRVIEAYLGHDASRRLASAG